MREFKKLIIGSNGVDIHTADGEFKEIATVFDKKYAYLMASAPELLDSLITIISEMEDRGWCLQTMAPAKIAIEKSLNIKK